MDGYSRPKFNKAGAMEWLCFRLDILSSMTFAFCLIFLISIPQGFIDSGTKHKSSILFTSQKCVCLYNGALEHNPPTSSFLFLN